MKKLILFLALILGIQTTGFAEMDDSALNLSTGNYMVYEKLKEMDGKLTYVRNTAKIYRVLFYIHLAFIPVAFIITSIAGAAAASHK